MISYSKPIESSTTKRRKLTGRQALIRIAFSLLALQNSNFQSILSLQDCSTLSCLHLWQTNFDTIVLWPLTDTNQSPFCSAELSASRSSAPETPIPRVQWKSLTYSTASTLLLTSLQIPKITLMSTRFVLDHLLPCLISSRTGGNYRW